MVQQVVTQQIDQESDHGMPVRLLTVVPELACFLNRFRHLMSRIRFRHFCRYILGLVASDRKSIRRITSSCQDAVDQSNLNRFMHSDAIDDSSIQARVMDMVWRDIAKRRPSGRLKVFLIIDDSLLQKFGTHMEGAGYIFSTKEHRSILCHDVVTSFMVAGGTGYQVDVRLFQKGPDVMHFLVSDIMGIGAGEVVADYDRRHRIEEFYRDGKQSLGLGEYMVRDSRASNRHWRWVFLAYALLVLVRDAEGLAGRTIGQMCDWVREKCAEVLVSRACTMARRSHETEQIVQALL